MILGRNTGLLCFCCAMMVCCRRPGRDKNTGLPIRWCCFSGARQRQPSCRSCCPSSTSPISVSTSWEVSRRMAQALAMSQSGSCTLTVPPLFALASAVSSLVAQSWEMTQAGRTSAQVAQAWTTSQAGCTSPRMATSMASSSRVFAGSVGCARCRTSCSRPGSLVVQLDLFLPCPGLPGLSLLPSVASLSVFSLLSTSTEWVCRRPGRGTNTGL